MSEARLSSRPALPGDQEDMPAGPADADDRRDELRLPDHNSNVLASRTRAHPGHTSTGNHESQQEALRTPSGRTGCPEPRTEPHPCSGSVPPGRQRSRKPLTNVERRRCSSALVSESSRRSGKHGDQNPAYRPTRALCRPGGDPGTPRGMDLRLNIAARAGVSVCYSTFRSHSV
jgi:hypothetical protein